MQQQKVDALIREDQMIMVRENKVQPEIGQNAVQEMI
jgi:hypothetical protein